MHRRWKKPLFATILAAGVLLVSELTLQFAALCSPRIDVLLAPPWRVAQITNQRLAPTVPDAVLGHRPNPAL
ncbi:MAG: hypothetical protein JXO22_15925, partial [Phycisphaerae bacterium]|nr:hypothetical protein [Phycisphaerae bacterium]